MSTRIQSMLDVFDKAQNTTSSHQNCITHLKTFYNEMDKSSFEEKFFHYIRKILSVADKSPYVDRAVEFVSKFVCTFTIPVSQPEKTMTEDSASNMECDPDVEYPLLVKLLEFLLSVYTAVSPGVRMRACQMIYKILISLEDNILDDDMVDRIEDAAIDALEDKISYVRVQAVLALSRLQDPFNRNCRVIDALLYHMNFDPFPEVRRTALTVIAGSTKTLVPIIDRTRDAKESVRRAAYLYLTEKISVTSLTISQRIRLLEEGLNDRSPSVCKIVEKKLVPFWLSLCENCPIKLLRMLDVHGATTTVEKVLNTIFKDKPIRDFVDDFLSVLVRRVIPEDNLTCENAFFWKFLCHKLKEEKDEESMDLLQSLLPELEEYSDYCLKYILKEKDDWDVLLRLEHKFISQQLLSLVAVIDMSDPVQRSKLNRTVQELILSTDVGADLIPQLVALVRLLYPSPEATLELLMSSISEIQAPMQDTLLESQPMQSSQRRLSAEATKLRFKLNNLRNELEYCLHHEEFAKAQNLKEQISCLETSLCERGSDDIDETVPVKNDPETLLKCLTITAEMLLQTPFKSFSVMLQACEESLVLPGITNEDPAIRKQAVRSMGLLCLINRSLAIERMFLFTQIALCDQPHIRVMALKAIFDLLLTFGLKPFKDLKVKVPSENADGSNTSVLVEEDEIENTPSIISFLADFLDSEESTVRSYAAEGFGKLLILGHVFSPTILAHLIVLWYSPATESEVFLRHFLGTFLPTYAHSGKSAQHCLEECFIPTIQLITKAPLSSPLTQVDANDVARFLIDLTYSYEDTDKEATVHDNLALKLLNEIMKDPTCFDVAIYAKALFYLDISEHASLEDIAQLCAKIKQKVYDKKSIQFMEKFTTMLSTKHDVVVPTLSSRTSGSFDIQSESSSGTPRRVVLSQNSSDLFPSPRQTPK